MEIEDNDQEFACIYCNSSPPVVDKWTPDDDDNNDDDDDEGKSSGDSVDNTADWYQQLIVHVSQNDTDVLAYHRHEQHVQSAAASSSLLAFYYYNYYTHLTACFPGQPG